MVRKSGWLVLAVIAVASAGCGGKQDATDVTARASTGETAIGRTNGEAGESPRPSAGWQEGRAACRGLSPLRAAERFEKAALRAGVRRHFAELVANPAPATETSAGYPRLVASLYATTVEPDRRSEAAAGCAEELVAQMGVEKDPSERTG